jgi:hypothetical protein
MGDSPLAEGIVTMVDPLPVIASFAAALAVELRLLPVFDTGVTVVTVGGRLTFNDDKVVIVRWVVSVDA